MHKKIIKDKRIRETKAFLISLSGTQMMFCELIILTLPTCFHYTIIKELEIIEQYKYFI